MHATVARNCCEPNASRQLNATAAWLTGEWWVGEKPVLLYRALLESPQRQKKVTKAATLASRVLARKVLLLRKLGEPDFPVPSSESRPSRECCIGSCAKPEENGGP